MKKLNILSLVIIALISCNNIKSERNTPELFRGKTHVIDATPDSIIWRGYEIDTFMGNTICQDSQDYLITNSLHIAKLNGLIYGTSPLSNVKYYSIIVSDGKGNEVKLISDSTMSFYFDKEHLEIKGDSTAVIIKLLQIYINEKINN